MNYFELTQCYDDKNYEQAPYKCKMCSMDEIPHSFEICRICGWQDDIVQNADQDYEGGANDLSFNQYKNVWQKNKQQIMNHNNAGSKAHLVEELFVDQGGIAKYVNATSVQKKKDWRDKIKN